VRLSYVYLERELGELLLRTEIPVDFSSDDMRWRWPSMRIFLPKGLICVERDGRQRNMNVRGCWLYGRSEEILPPQNCTDEMVRVFNRTTAVKFSDPRFIMLTFSTLDYSTIGLPSPFGRTVYWRGSPCRGYQAYRYWFDVEDPKARTLSIDQEDDLLMGRLNQVVLNILLYLSHLPVENESTEIRKPKRDGKRMIPGLYAARFIGDLQTRSKPIPREPTDPTGRHLPGHWRSGRWKRQAHGVGRSQRKLIWILPYKTLGSA
jgi:hypothetical protein